MIKTPIKTKIFGYSSLQEVLKSLDYLTYQRKTNEILATKDCEMRNKKMNILVIMVGTKYGFGSASIHTSDQGIE